MRRRLLIAVFWSCLAVGGTARSLPATLAQAGAAAGETLQSVAEAVIDGRITRADELLQGLISSGALAIDELVQELDERGNHRPREVLSLFEALPSEVLKQIEGQQDAPHARKSQSRLIALSALNRFGRSRDVGDLIALCRSRVVWHADRNLAREYQAVLTILLERGPLGFQLLEDHLLRLDPLLQTYSLRALGSLKTPESLGLLIDLVGRSAHLDCALLSQINSSARSTSTSGLQNRLLNIRAALGSNSKSTRREAALCVASLRSYDDLPQLVDLLDDVDAGVRASAHHALQKLTGFGFSSDSGDWVRWRERESAWWAEDAQACFEHLYRGTSAEQVSAVKELSRMRMNRTQIVDGLLSALQRSAPGAARSAALALGKLEARKGRRALIAGLKHANPDIRDACHQALNSIFALSLPPSPHLWLAQTKD